jgi:hypothetical protein
MAEAPQYEALSYVWGSNERTHTITCDQMLLAVTASLDTVLRVLRKPTESRIIWIDQICIDQDNIPERSEQVQIMREIYSRAFRVLMWLGTDDVSDAPLAIDLINDLIRVELEGPHSSSHPPTFLQFPTDIELRDLGLPMRESPKWNALNNMLKLPYFTRIWIVQEIAVAQAVTVMWGTSEISWATVHFAGSTALRLKLHLSDLGSLDSSPSPMLHLYPLNPLFRPAHSWNQLLRYTPDYYNATDLRGKVFTLIGLADDDIPMKANYQLTTSEVYAQTTIHMIESSKDLFPLAFSHNTNPNTKTGFPSWARSWSKTSSKAGSFSETGFHASKKSSPQLKESNNGRVLILDGFSFDNVRDLGVPIKNFGGESNLVEAFQLISKHADKLKDVYGVEPIKSFVSTLSIGSSWRPAIESPPIRFGQVQEDMLRGFASWIANLSMTRIRIAKESAPSCQRELLGLLSLTIGAQPDLLFDQDISHYSQEFRDWANKTMAGCHAPNQEVVASATKSFQSAIEFLDPKALLSFENTTVFTQDRKLFITSQGKLGIGPLCLESTDIICVLFGGNSLYALRPIPDTEEYFFLGECYVHGLMDGTAMEYHERGEFPTQSFRLR